MACTMPRYPKQAITLAQKKITQAIPKQGKEDLAKGAQKYKRASREKTTLTWYKVCMLTVS